LSIHKYVEQYLTLSVSTTVYENKATGCMFRPLPLIIKLSPII